MSDRALTIDGHVTRIDRADTGIDPTCPGTAWARIARVIVSDHPRGGRPCPPERWREHLDAILDVPRTGRARRHLPHDFAVGWSVAHKHFPRWCGAGIGTKILSDTR